MKTEILFGYHPVKEVIRAGRRRIIGLYAARKQNRKSTELIKLAETRGIAVFSTSAGELAGLSATDRHQGVCAKVGPYPLVDPDTLTGGGTKSEFSFIVMADSILDSRNLGALMRTALCAGAQGLILPKDRSAPPNSTVSKTSAGAMEHLPVSVVTNLVNTINELKHKHYWIIGLDGTASKSVFDIDRPDRAVLVVGGEEKGIRPLVKKNCDLLVSIPQAGPVDSLNASVAAGIAMYVLCQNRGI